MHGATIKIVFPSLYWVPTPKIKIRHELASEEHFQRYLSVFPFNFD